MFFAVKARFGGAKVDRRVVCKYLNLLIGEQNHVKNKAWCNWWLWHL